jgi:type VI secretion system protein
MLRKYLIIVIAVCFQLSGCSVLSILDSKKPVLDWKGLVVVTSEGANSNSALSFDVVFVFDDASLNLVSGLSASKWFASKIDLAKTFPKTLSYRSWEFVPGQTLEIPSAVFGPQRAVGVFIFCDYLVPGDHRQRVDQFRNGMIIQLNSREFTVSPQ